MGGNNIALVEIEVVVWICDVHLLFVYFLVGLWILRTYSCLQEIWHMSKS